MRGEHGERVGADLVRGVAVRGDPIRAGDDAVHVAGGHQRRGSGVCDHGVRDAGASRAPTPSGASPAAAAASRRPRRARAAPRSQRRAQRADGAAVAAGREAAGVAVRERARARRRRARAACRCHRAAALDLVVVQRACVRGSRVVTHLLERPGEVDRGRAGLRRARGRAVVEILAARRLRARARRQRRRRSPARRGSPARGSPRRPRRPIGTRSSTSSSGSRRWSRRTTVGPSSSYRTMSSGSRFLRPTRPGTSPAPR